MSEGEHYLMALIIFAFVVALFYFLWLNHSRNSSLGDAYPLPCEIWQSHPTLWSINIHIGIETYYAGTLGATTIHGAKK